MAHLLGLESEEREELAMFRGYGKREFAAWTAIICLVAFGSGAVLVKRFRSVGPMEFHELPASDQVPPAYITNPVPESIRGARAMTAIPGQPKQQLPLSPQEDTNPEIRPPAADTTPTKSHSKTKAVPELASVSLNAGEPADLEKLPGVGPGIAQRIIDYRTEHGPFQSLDELRNVKGIGEKRFAKIEPFLKL